MIETSAALEMLGLAEKKDDDILRALSEKDLLQKQSEESGRRLQALIYEYQALVSKYKELGKAKAKLEACIEKEREEEARRYDVMRLRLMLENVDLKAMLFDEMISQQRPALRVIKGAG